MVNPTKQLVLVQGRNYLVIVPTMFSADHAYAGADEQGNHLFTSPSALTPNGMMVIAVKPSEIIEIRERYGLSQRSLSKLLGWGEITIHRYESGSLQDEAHDEVLELISKPENLLEIYEKQAHLLAPYVSEALKKRIDDLIKKEIQPNFHKVLEQLFLSERKVGEFTGYKNFDLEKIKSMILYILGFHETYVTKINKLLWYMDFLCYKAYSVSISGNSYTHSAYGPTADDYELIISVMVILVRGL